MVKSFGSTRELLPKLHALSPTEGTGIKGVAVKCVEILENTSGDAGSWVGTDAEVRKCGERTGLDTLVVHTVNDGY